MVLWVIRIFFLLLCTTAGFEISQVQPELVGGSVYGTLIGFGLGGLLIAIDEMVKGLSLRAFSAATFGLILGNLIALLLDRSRLFDWVDQPTHWLIRLALFLSFSYLGMVLAMRSNKEDFYLIIPFVRFAPQKKAENLLVLDTSVIIDGRIAELIEGDFLEGIVVVPRFVLEELQAIADSNDPVRRARARRGLDVLSRIQRNPHNEVKIHEADFPEEKAVDAKLVRLAQLLDAKLFTNDYNLGKVAELQRVRHVNIHQLATSLKSALLPGEELHLKIIREGKEKGQGIAYLNDGTMVVVNNAQPFIGQQVQARVLSLRQTGTGIMVFAELKSS
jgi:uncharacterized protein YacL